MGGNDSLATNSTVTSDPSVAYDLNANAFFSFLKSFDDGKTYTLAVKKSTDGGTSWGSDVVIPDVGDADKDHMTIDVNSSGSPYKNFIYIAYTEFSGAAPHQIKFSRSTDGGLTFSSPQTISNTTGSMCQGVSLAVGPNGTLYATWVYYDSWPGFESAIGFNISTDGGASWGQVVGTPARFVPSGFCGIRSISPSTYLQKATPIRVNSYPVMDVDRSGGPNNGKIYIVWDNATNTANHTLPYIDLISSPPNPPNNSNWSTIWSSRTQINDDNSLTDKWEPWVKVDAYGGVNVVFYDSRIDPQNNILTQAYMARSTDGGASFPNYQISDYAFTPSQVQDIGDGYMGDYIGIATTREYAIPCWNDNRTGYQQAYAARFNILLDLANSNKSTNYWPAGYNNEQPLVRSADGKIHEVFSSGGEIFYRHSTNNASSWDITTMLSSGCGSNDCPSIAACFYYGSTSQLGVVWQQQLSWNTYAIWYSYSSNSGLTWSSPAKIKGCSNVTVSYYQSNTGYGQGPTPVIACYLVVGGGPSYVVVFAEQNGLLYTTSRNGQNNWSGSTNYVPGTYGGNNYSSIWHPSLTSYNTNVNNSIVFLIYADKYNGYYSQRYSSVPNSELWDSGPVLIHANTYCMSPSLSVDITSGTYAAWSEYEGSLGKYTMWQWSGTPSGTWPSSWYSEFTTIPENAFYPANTYYYYSGQQYPNRVDILAWGSANNDIWQVKSNGNGGWTEQTLSLGYTAAAPNLTHEVQGTGTPLQLWTNESQSPYIIEMGSNNLPKVAPAQVAVQTSRAAEMFDKIDHSDLRVDMTEPLITTASGSTISVPFKQYDYSQGVSVSSSSIFDYLRTDSVQIPSDAASMSFNLTVTIDLPDTLADGTVNKGTTSVLNGATVGLNIMGLSSGTPVLNSQPFTGSVASRHTKLSKAITVPMQSMQGKTIAFQPFGKLTGNFNEADLSLSLINVVGPVTPSAGETPQIASSAILPVNVTLGQNYPNPFNPSTTIAYRVAQAGRVSLKIYDVIGREVATVVNSDQNEGVHTQRFDASHLSSGIYFYQLIAPGVRETRKMLVTK